VTSPAIGTRFELHAEVPEFALFRLVVVDRPHRITPTSQHVTGTKRLRAGGATSNFSLSHPAGIILFAQNLDDPNGPNDAAVGESTALLMANADFTSISGRGHASGDALNDASAQVTFETRLAGTLVGDFDCSFSVTATNFTIGATSAFSFAVTRDGAPLFQTSSSATVNRLCTAAPTRSRLTPTSMCPRPEPAALQGRPPTRSR
jgi:hypothetical protein